MLRFFPSILAFPVFLIFVFLIFRDCRRRRPVGPMATRERYTRCDLCPSEGAMRRAAAPRHRLAATGAGP
jgi:hypothetical protein